MRMTIINKVMANISMLDVKDYRLERWAEYAALPRTFGLLLAFILIIVLVIGTIGNTVVLVLFAKYKSLRTSSNTFVVNQAASDLVMCILCLPVLIANSLRGHYEPNSEYVLCNIDASISALTGFVSIWSLAALAMDRCIVIRRSLPTPHSMDRSMTYFILLSIWIFCVMSSALPFMGLGRYVLEGSNMSCTFDYFSKTSNNIIYNVFIQVAFFGIPLLCIIICYLLIFLSVKKHERMYFSVRTGLNLREESFRRMRRNRKHERNELKTAKSGIILILVFCLSWMPYSALSLIALFGNNSWISPIIVTIPVVLAKVSTVLNPVLYAFVNSRFKSKLALTLYKYLRSWHDSGTQDRYPLEENCYGLSLRSTQRQSRRNSIISEV